MSAAREPVDGEIYGDRARMEEVQRPDIEGAARQVNAAGRLGDDFHAEALLYPVALAITAGSIENLTVPADRDGDEARFVPWRIGGSARLGANQARSHAF